MRRGFIKNDKIKYFIVKDNKVISTVLIAGKYISNPTIEEFLNDGWKEYIPPTPISTPKPDPYIPTIEELVESKLRERYSINQEFEVNRKRDINKQAFQAYYDYVEQCIVWAHNQPHREEEV